jgi:hypothetical protein
MMPSASLDVGPDGRVGVVWTSGHEDEELNVYFAESTDFGYSFGTNLCLHESPEGAQEDATIAYDAEGVVHVCWEDTHALLMDQDVLYAHSIDVEPFFSEPERIHSDPVGSGYSQEKVHLIADAQWGLAAVWLDNREAGDGNVYFARSASVVGIDPDVTVPGDESSTARGLALVYPNPSRGAIRIRARSALLYDVRGRTVRRLSAGAEAGGCELPWDGRDARGSRVPPGVYFLRLDTEDGWRTERVIIAR